MTTEPSGDQYYLCRIKGTNQIHKYFVYKLSGTGTVRWTLNHQGNGTLLFPGGFAVHQASGDIFVSGSSSVVSDIGLIQAAIALPDVYRPKRNTVFNSPETLTHNDRYMLGSVISLDTPPLHGVVTINANKTFVYTPNTNFVGTDTFKYRLTKPNLNVSKATVTLIVGN
jgi:hypothetical protein